MNYEIPECINIHSSRTQIGNDFCTNDFTLNVLTAVEPAQLNGKWLREINYFA